MVSLFIDVSIYLAVKVVEKLAKKNKKMCDRIPLKDYIEGLKFCLNSIFIIRFFPLKGEKIGSKR